MRSWTLVLVSLFALPFLMAPGCDDPPPEYLSPRCVSESNFHCVVDLDCSNNLYCDGAERCMPGASNADACGCVAASPRTACAANETCDEVEDRCHACTTDADGDGHRSLECGGDDCDDNDMDRFPGHPEICDAANHDEDCDATTFGEVDEDGDQFFKATCCNTGNDGMHCGTDCDDSNPAIVPGAQKCFKDGSTNVLICGEDGTFGAQTPCGSTYTCTVQPNGTGVCHP